MLPAQVYLQEFTWSEEDKPAAIARRADHAVHAVEHALLTAEPMFCFQTAVALHRWSCLTYMSACPSMSWIHAPCHRLHCMLFCSWVSTATWAGHDLLMSCSNPVQACPLTWPAHVWPHADLESVKLPGAKETAEKALQDAQQEGSAPAEIVGLPRGGLAGGRKVTSALLCCCKSRSALFGNQRAPHRMLEVLLCLSAAGGPEARRGAVQGITMRLRLHQISSTGSAGPVLGII